MFPVTDVQGADKHSLSLSNLYCMLSFRYRYEFFWQLCHYHSNRSCKIRQYICWLQVLHVFIRKCHQLFALLSILFSGIHGVYSYELHHSLTNRIPFQNRSRDIFLIDIDQEIQSIILEHNNENSSPAWFVDFLIIKFLTNQQEYL